MSKLWGSRFEGDSDNLADQFSFSIDYDYRLGLYDCEVGIAHATMLGEENIISKKDATAIVQGLKKILKSIEDGTFKFDPSAEDIHTNIQQVLKKDIGEAADRLHTARSRNDLIATDIKIYCHDEIVEIYTQLRDLQKAIVTFAEKNLHVIVPAYTHLQAAQVVLLAHHCLAYVEMIDRDMERLFDCASRIGKQMPLGSCALSGTSLPVDREKVRANLDFEFEAVSNNSIDSVSDRDFLAELISGLSILMMHFSRISEDFIIWSTSEFNYINIDWSLCTGSSIMPHKKNPDILELVRGETGTLYGNLQKILVLQKGLPLTYNRDLQLDKPPTFESIEKVKLIVPLMTKFFESLQVKEDVIAKRLKGDESFFSVDVMEYLIAKGVSYRDAHDVVGKIAKDCLDKGIGISQLSEAELKKFSPKFELDVKKLLNPEMSVKIKKSFGSTNPTMVKKQIANWKKRLS